MQAFLCHERAVLALELSCYSPAFAAKPRSLGKVGMPGLALRKVLNAVNVLDKGLRAYAEDFCRRLNDADLPANLVRALAGELVRRRIESSPRVMAYIGCAAEEVELLSPVFTLFVDPDFVELVVFSPTPLCPALQVPDPGSPHAELAESLLRACLRSRRGGAWARSPHLEPRA